MVRGDTLVCGRAEGLVVRLSEPLSFWGGLDSNSGIIIDQHHPQRGACLAGRIVVMPHGRGSSSSSSVIAEAARLGTAPRGIILHTPDPIITTGAIVAQELYSLSLPVIVVPRSDWDAIPAGGAAQLVASEEEAVVSYQPDQLV